MHTQEDLENLAISIQEFKEIYARNVPITHDKMNGIIRELVKRLTVVYGAEEGESLFEDICSRIIAYYGPIHHPELMRTYDRVLEMRRGLVPREKEVMDGVGAPERHQPIRNKFMIYLWALLRKYVK